MITRARTWLTATGGGMPRSFWLLWAGTVVNRLGFFVGPFLSLYLVSGRHITPTVAGLAVVRPLTSRLATRTPSPT